MNLHKKITHMFKNKIKDFDKKIKEKIKDFDKKIDKKMLAGFAVGTVAGAIAGILLAPKSGKETREDLKKIGDLIGREVAKKAEGVKELTEEKYHQIVEGVSDFYRKAKKLKESDRKKIINTFFHQKYFPFIIRKFFRNKINSDNILLNQVSYRIVS